MTQFTHQSKWRVEVLRDRCVPESRELRPPLIPHVIDSSGVARSR